MNVIQSVVRTERLVLRPFEGRDAERVLAIRSRLDVIRWLDNPPFVLMEDLDEARRWIDQANKREADEPGKVRRAVEVRETGLMVGTVLVDTMERIDGGFVGEHELGWHLHPDSTGHGYATEAARALAVAAFDAGHEVLMIDMYPDNAPSLAVAQRLGALDHGLIADDPWYGGEGRLLELRPEMLS